MVAVAAVGATPMAVIPTLRHGQTMVVVVAVVVAVVVDTTVGVVVVVATAGVPRTSKFHIEPADWVQCTAGVSWVSSI